MKHLLILLLALPVVMTTGCETEPEPQDPEMTGEFWKNQTIRDIIEPWTEQALNREIRTVPAFMDRDWTPTRSDHTFPGMFSRHVFSYSTAYVMTGEQTYLDIASELVEELLAHGWDEEHGLWYNEIDRQGRPVDLQKDLFMQLYAVTGLAMYYAVTRDKSVYRYIRESIELLEEHAWDHQYEGYINSLNRDLTVGDDSKRTTPQIAPISGYLAYLFPALRELEFLEQQRRGLEVVSGKMLDPETGWLLGSYSRNWELDREASSRVNVGHNVEMVWLLMRYYLLTGDETYREQALRLYDPLIEVAFRPETGAWYHWFSLDDPFDREDQASWWVHAYGNMTELYMYRVTGDPVHLDRFQKGARFWNRYFIDRELGGTFLGVTTVGELQRGDKATRSKTSYHSAEHGLLNYLYLRLWVEEKPATLYFNIRSSEEGERFYPHLIEDLDLKIRSVRIDGQPWENFNPDEGFITLPALSRGALEVNLTP